MNMKEQLLLLVQQRLAYLGYYLLICDGVEGPGTRNAVIEFKRNHGMNPRDFIGPLTLTTLFSEQAKKAPLPKLQLPKTTGNPKTKSKNVSVNVSVNEPLWLLEARRLLGTKEVIGKANNPIIMGWAKDLNQWYTGDDVPWCGLFTAHCMNFGAPEEPQEFNRLGARAWRAFGKKVPPSLGSIGVFWRTHKTRSANGHVAFIIGEGSDYYIIIGGNQSDNVTITKIAKERLLECRAPNDWEPIPLPKLTFAGALSVNEA